MEKDEKSNVDKVNESFDNDSSNDVKYDSSQVFDGSSLLPGELCPVGSIVEGTVASLARFGAFIELPDKRTGLVHISQVSEEFVKDINSYLHPGQKVKVYILSHEGEKTKLSIKKANSKLGLPQLSRSDIDSVNGGVDADKRFEYMMKNYQRQFLDTMHDRTSWEKRNGLN